jgi:pimeloyl-ACP methyl ester carboxylesterase
MKKRITANGLNFTVTDEGVGPCVLLLHGFPDSSLVWRHQIQPLTAAGFRVIVPDLRGFGESDRPEPLDAYRFKQITQDVLGILDALEVPSAHVVGHDFGAALSWLLAMRHPERIERLAVLSVGHPGGFAEPALEQYQLSWYMFFFQLPIAEEWLRRDDWTLTRTWLAGAPDLERYLADLSRPGALTAALNWYRANHVLPGGGRHEHPPVTAPTLGIWGADEIALTETQMTDSAEYVSGSWRYERIEKAGHWVQLDQPEAVNAILLDFLGGAA